MAESRSAYATLASLSPDLPTSQIMTELLRRLCAVTHAQQARIWRARADRLSAELSWPPAILRIPDVADPGMLDERDDVDASALIHDGARGYGAVTLRIPAGQIVDDELRHELAQTVECVLTTWRRAELRAAVRDQQRHTHRLAGELADSGRRLATVRDLERRRVGAEIITLSTGRLSQLRHRIVSLGAGLPVGAVPDSGATEEIRDLLQGLIEDFRVMVRGIHPQVLQTRGPGAALADVVAGLPRPARITGTIPARIDQELGAALYHLTTAALATLARTERQDPLLVNLSHPDGVLEVLVTGSAPTTAAALRAALTVDTDRLTAIGGGVEIGVEDAVVTLRAWVPDRLEPESRAPRPGRSSLVSRVRAVVLGLAAQYHGSPGYDRAQALVTRLDGPVRVGIQEFPGSVDSAALAVLSRRLPDLILGPDPGGPAVDAPDVVLRPAPGSDRRVEVGLTGSGVLIRSTAWADLPAALATEVVARADLLRARSVLTALGILFRAAPLTGAAAAWFGYELEELQAGAHELAELEAIAQLRSGALSLSRAQLRAAERLLGCAGTAPHERLGLPASATVAQLDQAAIEQLEPWRRMAETATVGRQQRQACTVIVETCEGLLTRATSPDPG